VLTCPSDVLIFSAVFRANYKETAAKLALSLVSTSAYVQRIMRIYNVVEDRLHQTAIKLQLLLLRVPTHYEYYSCGISSERGN
jgi:signal-transduction protein with cAMP-binding, CBS, and nucleotidyltransferase domain